MKILAKIGRILLFTFLIIVLIVLSVYYSHPIYFKQNLGKYFSNFKEITHFFKRQKNCKEFDNRCDNLNNRHRDYIWNSAYQKFSEPLKNAKEIKGHFVKGNLVLVENNKYYLVDTLFYSYAFLTPNAKNLLDTIGFQFQNNLRNTIFKGTQLHVTSLLRTESSIKRLRKRNRNSLRISSHLHGTSFDLDYDNFEFNDTLKREEILYLKDILALTLEELKNKGKCYVTYEYNQTCFHIVSRKK